MSDTEQERKESREPERYKFSNSYISSCANYLLGGERYTSLHYFLIKKIQEIRTPEEEQKLLTYSEMCDWVKKLIENYESPEDNK